MEDDFDGSGISDCDDMDLIYQKMKQTRSCINCDFRNNEVLKKVWYQMIYNNRYNRFEKWNFMGSIFPNNMTRIRRIPPTILKLRFSV